MRIKRKKSKALQQTLRSALFCSSTLLANIRKSTRSNKCTNGASTLPFLPSSTWSEAREPKLSTLGHGQDELALSCSSLATVFLFDSVLFWWPQLCTTRTSLRYYCAGLENECSLECCFIAFLDTLTCHRSPSFHSHLHFYPRKSYYFASIFSNRIWQGNTI